MNFVRPWLAIGSLRESYDRPLLYEEGIEAILQLAESVSHTGIETAYVPLEDGEPVSESKIERGVQFVQEQHAAGKTVLVACALGISRSVSFAAAALKESEGITLNEALAQILAAHPDARPHPILWESLCRHYGEEYSYAEVLRLRRERTRD